MKKLLTVFISCGHTCEFSDKWVYDDDNHWHKCADTECDLISGKTSHTYDEGKITEATQEADGAKTNDAVLRFENGKPAEYTFTAKMPTDSGEMLDTETTVTFTNFGTTKIAK